ncbi:MAG: ribonuclease J [Planctomycetota bacterium]|jgi:ribonuclease J
MNLPGQATHLEVVALGGLGEFGMNLMVYRWGDDCLVVDAGMMFPGAEHLGVEVVVPDLSFLDDCGTLHGLVLTHGHEDHIGSVPHLLSRHDIPVYASPYTSGLVRSRLEEHPSVSARGLRALPPDGEPLSLGPFRVETLSAAHSIPQAKMLVIETPIGTIIHTADFKLDPDPPDGVGTDLTRLAELGRRGVLALFSDSTNADRPGFTPSERSVTAGIDGQIASCRGRVLVTTFSSNIHRIQELAGLAAKHDRRLTLVGSSILDQAEVAERLGLLRIPSGLRLPADEVMSLPPERAMIVATGSQGEPLSALARISVDKHRDIHLEPGDRVIHSARVIPGNAKSIARMINHLLRRGAEVVTSAEAPVHVSGHPARDELRLLLQLVRPRYLLPIHGEYRQLHAHARLGVEIGLEPQHVPLAESGDLVAIGESEIRVVDQVPTGHVFIDATADRVDWQVLRDRRRIAGDGIVVPVLAIDRGSGTFSVDPEIVTRGFVPDSGDCDNGWMREAKNVVRASLADASPEERTDEAMLKARIQADLKRFLRRRTQRQPLIIPIIVEL